MKWWMTIGPVIDGKCRVDGNVPNGGIYRYDVDEQTARLLHRAKESGKQELRDQIKRILEGD